MGREMGWNMDIKRQGWICKISGVGKVQLGTTAGNEEQYEHLGAASDDAEWKGYITINRHKEKPDDAK